MRAGPNFVNRAELFLNSLAEPDHQSFKDPDRIQLKDHFKNSKIFSFCKISYHIINKSHIFNNVHNLSLIFNKNFSNIKNTLKHLFIFIFSHIFNKILLTISHNFCQSFANFKHLFKNII